MGKAGRTVASGIAVGLSVALLVGGCSGTLVPITPLPATPTPGPTETPSAPPAPAASSSPESSSPGSATPASPAAPAEAKLAIDTATGAEDFHFAADALSAPPGSTITLTLNNMTNPDDEVGHNWVLVKPGQEDAVLASGIAAGDDNDWLDKEDPGIIAATRLIEGNEKSSVTFDAPAPGGYTFLCTFPKHYAGGMKGTLTIG
jgi:azurin